jgi:S1-C subfamily serine protease
MRCTPPRPLCSLAGWSWPIGVCAVLSCVSSRAQDVQPRAAEPPLAAEEAAGRPISTPELRINPRTLASLDLPVAENLPKIEGGAISRGALSAELQRGIGAFLGQIRTKPAVHNGRFVGWRVIELFKKRPDVHVKALRAGDTVMKVNGRSLEHPEQLKLVWDSLSGADELVIEIERQGRRCQLRYVIV